MRKWVSNKWKREIEIAECRVSEVEYINMVKIHRIASGNVNCYIVADNDKAILIDTGRKKYREKILERCKKFHVSLIVLTHGHMDHCQNAAYLDILVMENQNEIGNG